MPNLFDKVLITGGGGMLASALASALRHRGHTPIVLNHQQLDIADHEQVFAATEAHEQSLCLNCAAYTKVDQAEIDEPIAERVNGRGPFVLAKARVPVVHFSTDFVFDGRATVPYRTDHPTAPLSAYGRTKLSGERQLLTWAPTSLIIRTSWLYGANGPNFVQTMLNAARAGRPLTVVDDQIGAPTFTHDLAEATLDLIDRGATGIFHATNSGQTTWFEFAKAIFEEFQIPNVDLKPISSVKWKEMRPTSAIRPAYSVLDCSETEKVVGRPMPHWRDALTRYRKELEPQMNTDEHR